MLHMPLCLTWLDYGGNASSNDSTLMNYVAVGSMEGVIELFDIDLVDQMEPFHTFGKKSKKKKSKKVRLEKKNETVESMGFVFRKTVRNRSKVTTPLYLI